MPNITPNYNLKKPLGTESALISVLNENFDTIDTALKPSVTDTTAPTSSSTSGLLATVLGWFANRIKAITGRTHWYEAPPTNLVNVAYHIGSGGSSHTEATTDTSGFMSAADKTLLDSTTSNAIGNTLMLRNETGRTKVASPSNAQDAANKEYVDNLVNNTFSRDKFIVTGSYTGDGTDERTILLDFTPSCVILTSAHGFTVSSGATSQQGGIALKGFNCLQKDCNDKSYLTTWDYKRCILGITTNGFKVSGYIDNSNPNMDGRQYYYIAIK